MKTLILCVDQNSLMRGAQALLSVNREISAGCLIYWFLLRDDWFFCVSPSAVWLEQQTRLSPLGLHDETDRPLLQVKDQRRVPVLSTETAQERVRAGRD